MPPDHSSLDQSPPLPLPLPLPPPAPAPGPAPPGFIDSEALTPEAGLPAARRRRPEGPGIWESIAWLTGVHVVQAGAALVGAVGLAMMYLATHPLAPAGVRPGARVEFGAYFRAMGPWFEEHLAVLLGIAGVATVLYGAVAVSVRLRHQGGLRGLGLKRPSAGHLMLIVLAVLPLSLLCSELQKSMIVLFPQGDHDLMQVFFAHLAAAPLPQVLWAIAIAPALGEELICRGLVGRGLIARWGVVPGVLVTSVLFGAMHVSPAQSIAVIPLGVAMHFAYLMTRSFWAPVLLHLLNNSFAVLVSKYGENWQFARILDENHPAPWHLMCASAAMVTALGLLLWQTRVRSSPKDGTGPSSGLIGAAPGAENTDADISQNPRPLLLACGAFNSLGFAAVLWQLTGGL